VNICEEQTFTYPWNTKLIMMLKNLEVLQPPEFHIKSLPVKV